MDTASRHLLAEYWGCDRALLDDAARLERLLRDACEACICEVLAVHSHRFAPHGVTVVAVLAESHASIHTWPEAGYAAVDVYTCGGGDPLRADPVLQAGLMATERELQLIHRGHPPDGR